MSPIRSTIDLLGFATILVVGAFFHPDLQGRTGPAIASFAVLMLVIGLAEQAYDRLLPRLGLFRQ